MYKQNPGLRNCSLVVPRMINFFWVEKKTFGSLLPAVGVPIGFSKKSFIIGHLYR